MWWMPTFLVRSYHMTVGQAGDVLGLLQNVVPPRMRATTCALLLFTANIANLVIAPQLMGLLSDQFTAHWGTGNESLRWALLILAPTGFWAAWHFGMTGRTIVHDQVVANGVGINSDSEKL